MGDSVVMQEAVLMLPRAGEACVGLIPLLIKLDTKSKECVSCFRVWVILIHMWKKKKANVEACGNAGFICEEANST